MDKDAFFQALANPCRREILQLLQGGGMSAGDIWAHFPVSQPSVSRHLEILRRAGLVSSRRRANQMIYSLDPQALEECGPWLWELFPDSR